MKKKLLFVIDSLTIGGAEKSLVSLLNMIDSSKYEIDLLLFKKGEDFEKYVPTYVKTLHAPEYFRFVNNEKFSVSKNILYTSYRFKTSLSLRLNKYRKNNLHDEQVVYKSIENLMTSLQKKYDVAIAYSQGMPTYFVANKVISSQKVAWINTDYFNTLYNKELDYKSYKKINKIVAVSQNTKESISKVKKEYDKKIEIILDITDPNMIRKMAKEHKVVEFDQSLINILTVGRLATVKGYDKAIEVARLLKNSCYKFKWYVVGEGTERKHLQDLIDRYKLQDHFILLGKKLNPYTYMKSCDIYVQTSLKEGFGLTVCEAKILQKPIVCTSFPTAQEIINNNVDGLIVDHNINSIYNGITKYINDNNFMEQVIKELNSLAPYSSVDQLEKFYRLVKN
ncbi:MULTISPECIES: glycosyltransferase [Priestia]|uniref:Glycosyltransferase n=1 Tax=Priestia aryabhattai TaxID=412384 RepID=A0ABD5KQ78_PRIAR|nr:MULTISPECIES: glycosyltransferase [Priestia]MBK0292119.1 glycosyltransferase [Bacillus sp. S34]UPK48073.1 glycosyltransferase [Bacillus sp. H8-1]MDC7764049.1 glycosyltransferase [Priestia aryabhattai]MEB4885999.1 glycosyltransferase [Priestia megaterium]MED5118434.1 glycosyltransferase [Priestia megaterium]